MCYGGKVLFFLLEPTIQEYVGTGTGTVLVCTVPRILIFQKFKIQNRN